MVTRAHLFIPYHEDAVNVEVVSEWATFPESELPLLTRSLLQALEKDSKVEAVRESAKAILTKVNEVDEKKAVEVEDDLKRAQKLFKVPLLSIISTFLGWTDHFAVSRCHRAWKQSSRNL